MTEPEGVAAAEQAAKELRTGIQKARRLVRRTRLLLRVALKRGDDNSQGGPAAA